MASPANITITVDVKVKLPLWDAVKLRLAGATTLLKKKSSSGKRRAVEYEAL